MKKIFITLFSLGLLFSCQKDEQYEDLNRDPKNPTQVSADFLYNAAVKSLVDQMTSTNVNRNIYRMLGQHWTETTYVDEANYDFNTRNIPDNHWSELYRDVLLDLKTAKTIVNASSGLSADAKAARVAQIEVIMVYTWQQLVDSFGDIPYTQAMNPSEFVLPEFDDAATIYEDLISRLTAARADLTNEGFGAADKIYGGDVAKWNKLANSLLLRLGHRIADVASMQALSQSTIQSAVAGGVFTSNADNALLAYEGSTPNTNPLWVDLVQSGRSDFVIANTLVDYMNELEDPRRPYYFAENLGDGVYLGGPYGDNNSFSNYTHIADAIQEPTFAGVLMDYTEVAFYLADAAERSYSGTPSDAEGFYNAAITSSFEYWGAPIGDYLSQPDVDYSTAPGTWREKIGKQMWLAMYNRGFEAWTAWRMYDTPDFNVAAISELPVPTRLTYPIDEQNLNEANWMAASSAIGGDEQTTKLFWDVF